MSAVIADPYAGIARRYLIASGYYGTHMRVLQGMQNASGYYGTHMRALQ
jgi:hypothetical protein